MNKKTHAPSSPQNFPLLYPAKRPNKGISSSNSQSLLLSKLLKSSTISGKKRLQQPLLQVKNLSVSYPPKTILKQINLSLFPKKILGIIGESGSGKSTLAKALQGLIPSEGKVVFSGKREKNSNEIAMIFQDPVSSLNPTMKVGKQILENFYECNPLRISSLFFSPFTYLKMRRKRRNHGVLQTLSLFEKLKLPNKKRVFDSYPHELSGGMCQRVLIAMALIKKPKILVADEPTASLDVTTQLALLNTLKSLVKNNPATSLVLISHDLSVIRHFTDEVAVLHEGKIIERQKTTSLFNAPKKSYTQFLLRQSHGLTSPLPRQALNSAPLSLSPSNSSSLSLYKAKKTPSCYPYQMPLLTCNQVSISFGEKAALSGIDFTLYEGEILGIVGESQGGKTTLSKAILGLIPLTSGSIKHQLTDIKKEIQYVFQNPYSSLNPRMTAKQIINEPLSIHKKKRSIDELMCLVGLSPSDKKKYPHEFSGGQRQRIAIARALALNPKLLILDEPTSALDANLRHQILDLLLDLKKKLSITMIFISHDLSLVRGIADRVAVMEKGKIVETNTAENIFKKPKHAFTKSLLRAALSEK